MSAAPGHLAESASLRGVLAPHAQISESMAFGIGGGIGAGYWLFDYKGLAAPLVQILTRHAWDSSRRFLQEACARLGLGATVKQTTSPAVAQRTLDQALVGGRPAVAWVSRGLSVDNDMPSEMAEWAGEIVVVRGASETGERYTIDDRGTPPFELSRAELAHTRGIVKRDKHRLLVVDQPAGPIDLAGGARDMLAALSARLQRIVDAEQAAAERLAALST